jgi:hypothetical protein
METQYVPPPPHPISPEAEKYIAAMTPVEKALHELALKVLGSSYFVEQTRGYKSAK